MISEDERQALKIFQEFGERIQLNRDIYIYIDNHVKNESQGFHMHIIGILDKWNRTERGNAIKTNRRKIMC